LRARAGIEDLDLLLRTDQRNTGLGRRKGSGPAAVAPLDALLDGIALIGIQTAELVLDIVTKFLANLEQRFALDV